jgi:hypothetical protein
MGFLIVDREAIAIPVRNHGRKRDNGHNEKDKNQGFD